MELNVQCCIAGGGPAGMMLGFLLARAGVQTLVLEKHADFLRDFRGDTIHPSTLEVLHELGLLPAFLTRPHQEARQLAGWIGDTRTVFADFTHLPTQCRFLAFMPQWDFLDFIASEAKRFPAFTLRTHAEVTGLEETAGVVTGVLARTPEGPLIVRAPLVVGADGRNSTVRQRAGLTVKDVGAPMDVLWLRISRKVDDPGEPLGRFDAGRILILIDRQDYWQCGFVIPKGGFVALQARGLAAFREELRRLAPFFGDRASEIAGWDDVKLLTVKVDRLERWWRPGLLCIGDAAHAMSPVGGVGINLAIQDAVAAANLLAGPLLQNRCRDTDLARVEARRRLPTVWTQRLQVLVQKRVIGRVLQNPTTLAVPWPLQLLRKWPMLQRIPARIIGLGFRPEHVRP